MYDVVVSTFKKNTNWTNKFDNTRYNVIKYTKNIHAQPSPTNLTVNKGHEASTYLKHIVENYDSLTEKTVFLHDDEYSWHHSGSIVRLVKTHIGRTDYFNLNSFVLGSILRNKHSPIMFEQYYKPYLEPYLGPHEPLGDWTVGKKGCAQYIVHKKHILNKPKVMYEDLLEWILTSRYGESVQCRNIEAKFMEWTWDVIFLTPCIHSESEVAAMYAERMSAKYFNWEQFGKTMPMNLNPVVGTERSPRLHGESERHGEHGESERHGEHGESERHGEHRPQRAFERSSTSNFNYVSVDASNGKVKLDEAPLERRPITKFTKIQFKPVDIVDKTNATIASDGKKYNYVVFDESQSELVMVDASNFKQMKIRAPSKINVQ